MTFKTFNAMSVCLQASVCLYGATGCDMQPKFPAPSIQKETRQSKKTIFAEQCVGWRVQIDTEPRFNV